MNGTPMKGFKMDMPSLLGLRGYSVLQNEVTKFRISQWQGALHWDKGPTHVSEAAPTC